MIQVIKLKTNPNKYSSNVFLILSEWKRLEDANVLVDTGSDGFIIENIKDINTGVGKKPVDKVIITHAHFDHTGGIKSLKEFCNPEIIANQAGEYVDTICDNGMHIQCGDSLFEIIYSPGHSFDSICLYSEEYQILFSGDTNLNIHSKDGTFTEEYYSTIERLSRLKIKKIYPGHGHIIEDRAEEMIKRSLQNIRASKIIEQNIN